MLHTVVSDLAVISPAVSGQLGELPLTGRKIPLIADEYVDPESATALVGEMKILIPMAGLIDKGAESARLAKELDRLTQDRSRAEAKLANPKFVDRAPPEVVDKERARLGEFQTAIAKLEEQKARIEAP